ncbi:MAG: ECF transporter S component [Bifidobacterium scardovii]|uniref:ECF transporter S component n=1 Tax=Bifidobacterium scardovii TaxID=158787 RepID=UPI0006650475|nr:ECF transporter S component [Bifidobacterium scardovii]MBS6946864.1 ECF transporter S component [Bifidobacterium scardovii]MDU3735573.1 ECF transporter S component [Bifidobacterium scardovii]MDU5297425.1 ECF transporter S component [Bifidobacterium scardovii]MDU5610595.1 ECF transporter S component [Bifidobacterium scardovii]MDU5887036.1 ECF transporter S component [Bifidobacterium scardovii]
MSATAAVKHSNKWRVVDIVVAAIVAVAAGVIFWAWDIVCAVPMAVLKSVTPGLDGLVSGMWLFAGPLAAIIVRKPGAALFAETVAAFIELLLGNPWGIAGSLIVGFIQGAFAEFGFTVFAYKKWNFVSTLVSGTMTGIGCWLYGWITSPGWGPLQIVVTLVSDAVSGAVIAGLLMWFLHRAIASTGVLDRFESGRSQALV